MYYEGFGYATADMVERIEEYMPIKPMIEYMRTTRRRVPDVEAMFHEKKMAVVTAALFQRYRNKSPGKKK